MSVCELCEKRRARRYCPGVRGDICPRCCGEEREISIDCPLECEFLQEARRHEKPPEVDPDEIPNKDIEVTKQFLHRNEHLVNHIGRALVTAALTTPGVVDSDVREALQAMIRTYLTLESGLIYETHTNNPYAGAIQQRLGTAISEYRRQMAEQTGVHTIRDKDVLGVLVFLQRVEYHQANGRRRGRAFLDFLRTHFPGDQPSAAGPVVVP